MKSLLGALLLGLSVVLVLWGLATAGQGLLFLSFDGASSSSRVFLDLGKGLLLLGLGYLAGSQAMHHLRDETSDRPSSAVQMPMTPIAPTPSAPPLAPTSAPAELASRDAIPEALEPDFASPPAGGKAWARGSILLALSSYACLAYMTIQGPGVPVQRGVIVQSAIPILALAGLVAAGLSIAQTRRITKLSGLALLLTVGPLVVLLILVVLFVGL